MNPRKQRYSIEEAKELDMVDYLCRLGYRPSKTSNDDYWYLSPLRVEKTPSFKINRTLNKWFDHGLGKGGNLIDFAIQFHSCTVSEFLQKVTSDFSFHQPVTLRSEKPFIESKINILREFKVRSFSVLNYLHQRRIPVDIADQFCVEIHYELNGKTYYGVGFKNDSGGYEIRNQYFKGSISPKNITTLNNGAKIVAVFEGFADFLSFMAIQKNQEQINSDFVILNSVSFFEKARPFLEQKHEQIQLYFDRDSTGQNYSHYALSLSSKYKDESHFYRQYKDLNDWLVNFGKTQKKNLRFKL